MGSRLISCSFKITTQRFFSSRIKTATRPWLGFSLSIPSATIERRFQTSFESVFVSSQVGGLGSQLRVFSSSTLKRNLNNNVDNKLLREYTREDVDNWVKDNFPILIYEDKITKQKVSILSGVSGSELSTMTKQEIQGLVDRHVLNLGTLKPEALSHVTSLYLAIQKLKPGASIPPRKRLNEEVQASLQEFKRWCHLQASSFGNLKVGDIVELPSLGERPKELGDIANEESPLKRVLLTQDRLDHILLVSNQLALGSEDYPTGEKYMGRILSGPNGVGKTVLSYLTTAIAWVNGAVVLYIPKMSIWTKAGMITPGGVPRFEEDKAAKYVLEKFVSLNAEKLASLPCKLEGHEGLSLLDLVDRGIFGGEGANEVLESVYQELRQVTQTPVLYVFDEHQWIYKRNLQGESFFTKYITNTDVLQGVRTYVLISGSAHSKFEHSLQSSMQGWLHHLQPLSMEEFLMLVGDNGPFMLPKEFRTEETYRVTGGIPREIKNLKEALDGKKFQSLRDYTDQATEWYTTAVHKWVDERPTARDHYIEFLESVFDPSTKGVGATAGKQFIDTGLLYWKHENKTYQPTCLPVRRALLRYLYSALPSKSLSVERSRGGDRGIKFQECVRRVLFRGITFTAFYLGKPSKKETIALPAAKQQLEFNTNEVPPNYGQLGVPTLYTPDALNYPAWDFVYHIPPSDPTDPVHRLVFLQTSVTQTPFYASKYPDRFYDFFEKGRMKDIIKRITGIDCEATITAKGCFSITTAKPNRLDAQFVFITETPFVKFQENTEKDIDAIGNRALQNLLIVSKEECSESFHILFDETKPKRLRGEKKKSRQKKGEPPK